MQEHIRDLVGFFDPVSGVWEAQKPAVTYSEQRLAVHEEALSLSGMGNFPTLFDVHQSHPDAETVYSFSGSFWKVFRDVVNMAAQHIHINNRRKGFWPNNDTATGSLKLALYPETHGRNVGEVLALMTSEESEALDAYRTGGIEQKDDKLPHRSGLYTEIADSMIRGLDFLGGMMADAGSIIVEKVTYNKESRGHLHGKRF